MDTYSELHERYVYCQVCGAAVSENLEAHHIQFRSRGGGDETDNLVMLCHECHQKRHGERIDIFIQNNMLVVEDKQTGEIQVKPLVPQVAMTPSALVDQSRAVRDWLGLMIYAGRLREEPDEALATLYEELRHLKHRLWMAQAAIINEMQSRANYGDATAKHVAAALGCGERTVQSRGQIFREIISKPECSQACEKLLGESFYKEAVSTDNPIHWINYASERKVENPSYTVAQFREEIRSDGEESSLRQVVLYCERQNQADMRIAERLQRTLGVPVTVVFEEVAAKVLAGTPVGSTR